jgi:hypothetical protein
MEIINIGEAPNDNTGDPLRFAGQKINKNFDDINNDFLKKDALGSPGGAPLINEDGAIEALVHHRIDTPGNLSTILLGDGELAIERDGDYNAIRIGDGSKVGGRRVAGSLLFQWNDIVTTATSWTNLFTIPAYAGPFVLISGRIRINNPTLDIFRVQMPGITSGYRPFLIVRKQIEGVWGSPQMEELGGIGVIGHNETMELVFASPVIAIDTDGLNFRYQRAANTNGNVTIVGGSIVVTPLTTFV